MNKPPEYYYSEEYLMNLLMTVAKRHSTEDYTDYILYVATRAIRLDLEMSQDFLAILKKLDIDIDKLREEVNSKSTDKS